jgi:outer membrane protein assembly factor BamA
MRSEIRDMFTEILIEGDIEKIKAQYKQRLYNEFQIALEKATEGDLTLI